MSKQEKIKSDEYILSEDLKDKDSIKKQNANRSALMLTKNRALGKRMLLTAIDAIISLIAALITGLFVSVGGLVFDEVPTVSHAGFIGLTYQIIAMSLFGGYRYVVKYSDIHYNVRLCLIFAIVFICQWVTVGAMFGTQLHGWFESLRFSFIQTLIAFCAILVSRFIYQFYIAVQGRKYFAKSNGKRVMIIGAGWTGKRVLSDLSREKDKYYPVCFIDDDPEKIGKIMDNVPIVGGNKTIESNIARYRVDKIIFAIPLASTEVKQNILSRCVATGREVNILPNIADLVAKGDVLSIMRKVKIEDLLERDVVKFDINEVSAFINNKVCMVTGGGGSIGSELCRQIASFAPKKLIIADIYENSSFDIATELNEKYSQNLDLQVEIVSVTDYDEMEKIFARENVDLVFHAAAHKHVPLMEHNPDEAVKNNVVGTWNIASLCAKYKVKKMVMVSTDKAVNPTNVMGATKRFCEKIVEYWGTQTEDTKYSVTRFGNVLGSNGSVIHIFNRQIAAGGPVKVTHPEIIRYFMTIPEAVSLILQSGVFANGGEVFVLDMGKPVRIVTLAENMIRLAGLTPYEDINIEFTGLRPGEKLYEELLMSEEGMKKTPNDKIYIGNQSYIADAELPDKYEQLVAAARTDDDSTTIAALCDVVETYTPDARYHSASGTVTTLDKPARHDLKEIERKEDQLKARNRKVPPQKPLGAPSADKDKNDPDGLMSASSNN